ncbi:MAG: hypothetical protein RLZZ53_3022 [Acidobacteriota bacterium]|jgi:hypothetical protein
MKMRVVAIPLIAAICYGSPAVASPTTDEQMVRGRGARDRSGGDGGARAAGGGDGERRSGGGERTAERRGGDSRRDDGGQPRTSVARRGDDDHRQSTRTETSRRDNANRDRDRRENDRGDNRRDGDHVSNANRDTGGRYAVPRVYTRDRDFGRNPRVVVRNTRPDIHINFGSPYRNGYRYYTPVHYDRWARSYYRWSPVSYLPLGLIYGSIGFSNFGVYGGWGNAYPYYDPYASAYGSPWRTSGYDVGGIRLKIQPRDAQVFVDGYYAGIVDDFDGTFQSLRLEAGGHKIEVRMPGFADMELDVHVQPGRTLTLAEVMQPRP